MKHLYIIIMSSILVGCFGENPLETSLENINYHREFIDNSGSPKENYDLYESVFVENQNEPYIYYLLSKIEHKDPNLGSNYYDMGIKIFPSDPYLNVLKISIEKGLNKPESLESWIKLSEIHPSSPIITFNVLRTYSIIPDSIKNKDIVNHFNIVKSIDHITEKFYGSKSNSKFYNYSSGYYDLREIQMDYIKNKTIYNKKEKNKLENSPEVINFLKKIEEERKEKERIENEKKKRKERVENEKKRIKELYSKLYNSTYWFNDKRPIKGSKSKLNFGSFIEFFKNGIVMTGNDDGVVNSLKTGTFKFISNSKIRISGFKQSFSGGFKMSNRNGIYKVVIKKGYKIYLEDINDTNGFLWISSSQRSSDYQYRKNHLNDYID